MKKTLLFFLLMFSTLTIYSQIFGTTEIVLKAGYSVEFEINGNTNMTTITLKGPDNVWMGVGFGGGTTMASGADVFRTDGTDITDARSTGRFLPTADASQDWSLQSNTTNGGVRTIIATRANNTGDPNDFIFNAAEGSLTLIWAHGTSTSYGFHGTNFGSTVVSTLSVRRAERLDFRMYPNPVLDEVTVQLPSGTNKAKVSLFDYTGRLISVNEVSSFNKTVNTTNLTSGIYLLKVESGNKIGTQKLIKN